MFDFVIIIVEIKDFSPLGMQNIAHHIISIIATFSAIGAGGYYITSAAATIFTEVSTIVLHIRFYMIKSQIADGKSFLFVMITFISLFAYSRMFI